jgi:hypothetical protein
MKDNIELQKQLEEAKNADYAKEWKTSVNNKGETRHTNDTLGMILIMHNLTNEEIDQIEQKFNRNII